MALNNGVEQVSAINKTSLNNYTKPPPPQKKKRKKRKKKKRKNWVSNNILPP
jgi:hypothetical protein